MPDQINDLIKKISANANAILVIGEIDNGLDNVSSVSISEDMFDVLYDHGLFDLVLIKGLMENLSHEKAENIIAQIRDTHAREILLVVSNNSEWSDTDLLGLNLRKIAEIKQQNEVLQAWYFALENYKRTPSWLNSRYWANPEMFEKYRW